MKPRLDTGQFPKTNCYIGQKPFRTPPTACRFGNFCLALSLSLIITAEVFAQAQTDSYSSTNQHRGAAELEWVARENLSDEMLALCPRSCSGIYVEQERSYAGVELSPRSASIEVISDLSEVDGEEDIAVMEGNVELIQGWRSVQADEIRILQGEDRIEMEGDIRLREPGMLITGRAASIENTSQAMQFEEAEFVLHDLGVRGTAEEVGRDAEGRFYVLNATYSTCEPGEDHWSLSAKEISIDEDNLFATAKSMTIRVGDVPIFYAPWFAFPVGEGRQTGLLYPVISQSGDNGLDLTQPIYFNLATNYDLTLAPRLVQERGVGIETEFRYLNSNSMNQVNLAFLAKDKGGRDNSQEGENRWLFGLSHRGSWGVPQTFIDYNKASDKDYFEDLGSATTEINTRTYLKQYGDVSGDIDNWVLSASALGYQTIAEDFTDTYRELPNISFNALYRFNYFDLKLDHQIVNFDHKLDQLPDSAAVLQADTEGTWVTGQRAKLDYSLETAFNLGWGKFDAEIMGMSRFYNLDEALAGYQDTRPEIQAKGFRVRVETNFERNLDILGDNWIQTLQPSVQYLNLNTELQSEVPIFDTRRASPSYNRLFRANQFMGGDRVSDANQITLGVTSRIINPTNSAQTARISIGQSFYFEDREVHASELIQLGLGDPASFSTSDPLYLLARETQGELAQLSRGQSNLIAEAELRINQEWTLTTDAHLNTKSNQLERGHLSFSYLSEDSLNAFNFGYHYAAELTNFVDINGDNLVQSQELFEGDTSQYDISVVRALSDSWTMVARWQQDAALDRSLEQLVGARYDSCCWSTGIYWREWLKRDDDILIPQTDLRRDSGIFISFELKGLAGVGQSIESLLQKGIPGYNRENF